MKIITPLQGLSITVKLIMLGMLINTSAQAMQRITPAGTGNDYVGSQTTITYSGIYSVTSPQTGEETGIGLRIHYNSSLLTPIDNQLYSPGLQPGGEISDDTEDYDSDPLTDKYFILAWVDVSAQWPGQSALPLNLFDAQFETTTQFAQDTAIRISATATAKNTPFSSGPLNIHPVPTVNLSTSKTHVTEGTGGSLIIYVTRSKEDLSEPLEVFIQLGGTASADSDYQAFPDSIIIPADKEQGFATLLLKDDASNESQETITVSIAANTQYQRGTSDTLQLTIEDDETSQNTSLPIDNGINKETVTTASNAIPTINEWMLALMSLIIAGLALTHLMTTRKRNA